MSTEDSEYFEDQNLAFLPAAHPLMAKLQEALRKTLSEDHERVHLQLKSLETNFKKSDKVKEDVAVQLYEVQQQLAELHLRLEQSHQNYNLLEKLRVQAEDNVVIMNKEHDKQAQQVTNIEKSVLRAHDELAKVSRTVNQIEAFNKDIKSEIAVTRTATYRAEENISNQESAKKKQDFLLDYLVDQKKQVSEQLDMVTVQLMSQKGETKAAQDILKEAFVEMENIIVSKKNLIERWQKSLLEMQKRDKALQVAREALRVQGEVHMNIHSEIAGVEKETRKEADLAETLAAAYNRLRLDEKHIDEERAKLDHQNQKLGAQIQILQQSLKTTEANTGVVEREIKQNQEQMHQIEENIMKIHIQSAKLYDEIIVRINEHKTLEKTSANLLRQAQLVSQEVENKMIEEENTENEIARVHLDMLNTTNQIETLKQRKREVSEERKQKEETSATYELEIRQGHDINEKKQSEVGKLNKVHDQIVGSVSEVSRGPLDAHKNHLMNNLKEVNEKTARQEKDWIKKQTKLVKYQEQHEKSSEDISNMKTKKTIMEQKRMRLKAILEGHEKEIRDVRLSLKNLQSEMNKLNDGLSKNSSAEIKLKNENYHIQSDVVEKIKELESGNVKMEMDIDRLKEEKAELLSNILEAEKHMLLWERKIKLEKEIQEALDPNIGQSELKTLKKDIHRMELRLDEIKKRQEYIIQEMDKTVYKREIIQLKYTKADDSENNPKGGGKARIDRQIENLKSSLAQSAKNNKDMEVKLRKIQAELNNNGSAMSSCENALKESEESLKNAFNSIVEHKVEKLKGIFEVSKIQTIYKGCESLAADRFKLEAPEVTIRQRYEKQKATNNTIIEALTDAIESNPQYASVLRKLIRI